MEQLEKRANPLDLKKFKFERNQKAFSEIAEEIKSGRIQVPIVSDHYLFGQTDEVLHFALEGQKLSINSVVYQEKVEESKREILKAIGIIIDGISKIDIKNNCPVCSMDASAERIRALAEQIR